MNVGMSSISQCEHLHLTCFSLVPGCEFRVDILPGCLRGLSEALLPRLLPPPVLAFCSRLLIANTWDCQYYGLLVNSKIIGQSAGLENGLHGPLELVVEVPEGALELVLLFTAQALVPAAAELPALVLPELPLVLEQENLPHHFRRHQVLGLLEDHDVLPLLHIADLLVGGGPLLRGEDAGPGLGGALVLLLLLDPALADRLVPRLLGAPVGRQHLLEQLIPADPILLVNGEHACQQVLAEGGDVGGQHQGLVLYVSVQVRFGHAGPGRLLGQQLVVDETERPDIGLGCVLGLAEDLWGHVEGRADDGVEHLVLILIDYLGEPEVSQLELALGVDKDVGRLQVPVDDVIVNQLLEALQHVPQDVQGGLLIDFVLLHVLGQVHLAVLQDQVHAVALAEVVHQPHNVGVLDFVQDGYLVHQDGDRGPGQPLEVHLLDGVGGRVVDLPETALSQHILQSVLLRMLLAHYLHRVLNRFNDYGKVFQFVITTRLHYKNHLLISFISVSISFRDSSSMCRGLRQRLLRYLPSSLSITCLQMIWLQIMVPATMHENPISLTALTQKLRDSIQQAGSLAVRLTKMPKNQISAVRQMLSSDRVRLSISWVIVTPQNVYRGTNTIPAATSTNSWKLVKIWYRQVEGISMKASPWQLYTHLLPENGHGMNDTTITINSEKMEPQKPSQPTMYSGLTSYFLSIFCSQAQKNPLNTSDTIMSAYPSFQLPLS